MKKHLLETATLVFAAVICALVANALASNQRKVALAGNYPNALKVTVGGERTSRPLPAAVAAPEPQPPVMQGTVTEAVPAVTTAAAETAKSEPTAPEPKAAPRSGGDVRSPREFKPHPDKAFVEIGYDDVAALHAAGALFLDARRSSVYEEGHIAGARPFSVWEADIDDKVAALFGERSDPRSQNEPIVIYCSGGACEDSHMLAQKLWGVQFNNVYVYKDGFPDWLKRGGAIRTGTTP